MASTSPIAVLDTGAGGLSVVKALRKLLPSEEIHYFADTAHLPYGIKSPELISHLSLKMARRLYELSSCKILVVACHTISTLCLDKLSDALPVPVIGMVVPTIDALKDIVHAHNQIGSVGVISTKATVFSNAYRNAWPMIDSTGKVILVEHPAGPLVSLVEEPDIDMAIIPALVENLLPAAIKQCDALVIGCTHFSALVPVLKSIAKPGCLMVDAADFAAVETFRSLKKSSLLNQQITSGRITAYVSDNPARFQIIARRFIDENFPVEWLRDYARS